MRIPAMLDNDKLCVQFCIRTCPYLGEPLKVMWTKDTLHMGEFYVSESLLKDVEANPALSTDGTLYQPVFDENSDFTGLRRQYDPLSRKTMPHAYACGMFFGVSLSGGISSIRLISSTVASSLGSRRSMVVRCSSGDQGSNADGSHRRPCPVADGGGNASDPGFMLLVVNGISPGTDALHLTDHVRERW
ncbi:MAG: hypothetical protein V8R55_05600 [Dysosmobacter sp.]